MRTIYMLLILSIGSISSSINGQAVNLAVSEIDDALLKNASAVVRFDHTQVDQSNRKKLHVYLSLIHI